MTPPVPTPAGRSLLARVDASSADALAQARELAGGRGERLWDGLEGLEQGFDVQTVASPSGVVHLQFARRSKASGT